MIARKSTLIIVTQLINGLLGYVALYFITRYMEPGTYGIMAFAYSFVALFSIIGNLGFDHAHVKRVSEGKDVGTCIGTFLATKLGLTGLMAIVTLISIVVWKLVLGRGFETSTHETAVYIMLVYWIIRVIAQFMTTTFQGRKEIAKLQFPNFFEVLVRSISIIFVALSGWGTIALVLTYIVGDIIFFLSSLYFFRGYPISYPSKETFQDYTKFAFPLSIVVASTILMTNVDKVLIQLFWSASDVGYYFAAFRMTQFIALFTGAIGLLLFPTFSSLHSRNDVGGICNLTIQSERYLSMIVFPVVMGVIVLAQPISGILLSGWKEIIPILHILPLFVLLDALERPYQTQFMGMNYPKLARNRVLIMVVVNIVLNLILIPRDIQSLGLSLFGLGAQGAAIATVVAYGVGLVYSRIVAWKLTGITGNPRVLFHLLAAGIMMTVLYIITIMIPIGRWYILLAVALFGFVIYIGVLYLIREFSKQDLDLFFDALNIKKMVQYIKEEIRGKP